MKKRQVIALLGSTALALALVLSACAPAAETPAPAAPTTPAAPQVVETVVEKVVAPVYKVINPQGTYIPVDCKPCAPRLTTFDGKTILAYKSEGSSIIWPALYPVLQQKFPNTKWVYVDTEGFGRSTPNDADLACDAMIRGVSW